jgi:hypothetical protein
MINLQNSQLTFLTMNSAGRFEWGTLLLTLQ